MVILKAILLIMVMALLLAVAMLTLGIYFIVIDIRSDLSEHRDRARVSMENYSELMRVFDKKIEKR